MLSGIFLGLFLLSVNLQKVICFKNDYYYDLIYGDNNDNQNYDDNSQNDYTYIEDFLSDYDIDLSDGSDGTNDDGSTVGGTGGAGGSGGSAPPATGGSSGGSGGSSGSSSKGEGKIGKDGMITTHQRRPDTSTPELWNGMIVTIASVLDYNNNVMTDSKEGKKFAKLLPWKKGNKHQQWKLVQAGLTNWKFQNLATKRCIGVSLFSPIPKKEEDDYDYEDDGSSSSLPGSKHSLWYVNTQPCWTDKKDILKSKKVEWELNSIHQRGKHMGNFYVVNNPQIKPHGCFTFKNIATYSPMFYKQCKYGAPSQFIRIRCIAHCKLQSYKK